MHNFIRSLTLLFLLVALASWSPANANTVRCVRNGPNGAADLDKYLKEWTTAKDQTIYIHIEKGTYFLSGYRQYEQYFLGDGNASLHLVGGFVPGGSGAGCNIGRDVDASNTVIQGDAQFFLGQQGAELLVDGLTFTGFTAPPNSFRALSFETVPDSSLTLRNVIITNITDPALDSAAVVVDIYDADVVGANAATIRIENCLIHGNPGAKNGLLIFDGESADNTKVLGCTIVGNPGYGVVIGGAYGVEGTFQIANSIVLGNESGGLYLLASNNAPLIYNTDYDTIVGAYTGFNNKHDIDPVFVDPAAGKYQLQANSPLINKGALASDLGSNFKFADTDIRGRTRKVGSHVDIGAYETLVDDTAPQTVSITADSETGATLRAAIKTANSSANATTINFNINGTCPQVIELTGLLPDITSDITIDGYTQPAPLGSLGATPNNISPGYDGRICIVLRSGGFDHALKTSGNGRLTLRGIEFEGFTTAAVRLATGSGNIVTGNAFAAFPGAASNVGGVLIEGSATNSQIGSTADGDRNVFGASDYAAVWLFNNGAGNNLIEGNYVGFNADGTARTGLANKYGMYVQNSGTNFIRSNFIGGSAFSAIELTGAGATANELTHNTLGAAPADNSSVPNGGGDCNPFCFGGYASIDLAAGAHDNDIGTFGSNFIGLLSGLSGGNIITGNLGPGVRVEVNAGKGNRIFTNNLIHDNNSYLAIDLGPLGATANDDTDADTGGNNLQNYPFLSQAMRVGPGTIRLSGFLQTQTVPSTSQKYRIDVYWTDACVAGDATGPRGEFKRYVGSLSPALETDGNQHLVPFSTTDIKAMTSLPGTGFLSATATDESGNTSEPGPCHTYIDDYIFLDAFD